MSRVTDYLNLSSSIDAEFQQSLTSSDALELLKEGNKRFLANSKNQRERRNLLDGAAKGQAPYAAVLGCIDSRAPIEEIFDAQIGDLFVARVAGNTVNGDILGSIEYACKYAGSKLVLVLGHSSCGAVKGAYAALKDGNLTGLLERIEPAVAPVREAHGESPSDEAIDTCVANNVRLVCERIKKESEILAGLAADGSIAIVGGVYNVATGEVDFTIYN
jgi:carbonic anhydrase